MTKAVISILILIIFFLTSYILFENKRDKFQIVTKNDDVYKLNNESGEVVLIDGTREYIVKKLGKSIDKNELVISTVKSGNELSAFFFKNGEITDSNEKAVRELYKSLTLFGGEWKCTEKEAGIFIVIFNAENLGKLTTDGLVFEYNETMNVVRFVNGNEELCKKYNVRLLKRKI